MSWIESHDTLRQHPKTLRLARALNVNVREAIGLLHCLWWWAMDYAADGDLSRYEPGEIGDAVDWPDGEQLVQALQRSGFLDEMYLHDWPEYGEKLHRRRLANAERVRQHRAKEADASDGEARNAHVMRTCALRNGATVQDSTVQDRGSTSPTPPTGSGKTGETPRQNGTNPRAVSTNPRAVGTNPRAEETNPRAARAAAAALRSDGVDPAPATTPEDIIETHVCTCIPPDWREAWREHVKLWRQAVPGDRRPEKLAWHQAYFRRVRAHCEEHAPPGEEQALLVAVSRTFFAHGAAHKRFGAEIRASGYDAGHWLSWSKTGHWDSVSADEPETDHATFYDPETKCSYSRAAFEALMKARKNGNGKAPPKREPVPVGVTPEGRARVLAAMQQLSAAKGLPS